MEVNLMRSCLQITTSKLNAYVVCAIGIPAVIQVLAGELGAVSTAAGSRTQSRRRNRTQRAIVTIEVAGALVLLAGAGILARAYGWLRYEALGADPTNVWVITTEFDSSRATPEDRRRDADAIVDVLHRIPG